MANILLPNDLVPAAQVPAIDLPNDLVPAAPQSSIALPADLQPAEPKAPDPSFWQKASDTVTHLLSSRVVDEKGNIKRGMAEKALSDLWGSELGFSPQSIEEMRQSGILSQSPSDSYASRERFVRAAGRTGDIIGRSLATPFVFGIHAFVDAIPGMSDSSKDRLARDLMGVLESEGARFGEQVSLPQAGPSVNKPGTPIELPSDLVPAAGVKGVSAAERAVPGITAPAAETAVSVAPDAAGALQSKINGLMAGDRVIMTPQQLEILQSGSAAETAGAARKLPGAATEPIVKETLSRDVTGALKDMLEAGKVRMVPDIKVTDQVLALMRSDILPAETYNAILAKHGLDPVRFLDAVTQGELGAGMRASSRVSGQTLQQLSELRKVEMRLRQAAGDQSPEVAEFLARNGGADEISTGLRGAMKQIKGIWVGSLVGQLATSARNALTAVATAGVDTLAKGMEAGLRGVFNTGARIAGKPTIDDPIGAFANWAALVKYKKSKAITDAIASARPEVRDGLFGTYASDVSRATGASKVLNKVQKGVEVINFHGKFQEFIFRRAFFAAELQKRLEARGMNLDELVRTNRIGSIPQEDLAGSIQEALRLTYGRPLGYEGFDKWMRNFNEFQSLGGYNPFPPFPFVRFMTDAMKWQFEHSPFGPVRLLSKTERAALGAKGSLKVASRALAGSSLLYTAYMLRNSGYAGPEWFSVNVPGTDKSVDLRPFNPITSYLFVADIIKRATDGTLAGMDGKEIAQGLIGANFRAGAGLYLVDSLISQLAGNEGAPAKVERIVKTWAGEVLAGFLTPFQTLKDVVSHFDLNEGIVRDTRQSPLTGPSQSRIPFLSQNLPELKSPTRSGPVTAAAPLTRQLTGLTVQEEKNAAEAELKRLGFRNKDVLPSSGDPAYDRIMAEFMGPAVEKLIGRVVTGPVYQSRDNPTKAYIVDQVLKEIRAAATKAVPSVDAGLAIKRQFARKGLRERLFLEHLFNQMPPERRDAIMKLLIR